MPERVEPCLALLVGKPPEGDDWLFEVKWDGYRLAIHIEPARKVRILTRGGHDWTHRFPTIAAAAAELDVQTAIIDGEAVVLDQKGASNFAALQKALGGRGGKRHAEEAILFAFDLLYFNGHDLRGLSLEERREMLVQAHEGAPPGIRISEEIDAPGAALLRQACAMGLEGVIGKRRDSRYRSGRGGEWIKAKCIQSETFLIVGYEPSSVALGGIGSLLLAGDSSYGWVYAGDVGTGFSVATGTDLRRRLDRLTTTTPAVKIRGRKRVVWVKPVLAAEIEFRGWTDDHKLRHASYKGFRDKAEMGAIFRVA
ncbi:bifunctional non-homologous end joining protein LigD [Bosea sp. BK604]|nr:bifunctional non-homologous end joining protein LigD [Bosea sp. BK604]